MRVTLRDVAKRVDLSHATVSFVLNGRMDVSIPAVTRERVLLAAKEMGYRPNRAAQALVRGRTNMVALWMPLEPCAHYRPAQVELARLAARDGFDLVTRLFDFRRGVRLSNVDVGRLATVDGILAFDCCEPGGTDFAAPTGVPLVSLGVLFDSGNDHVGIEGCGGGTGGDGALVAAGASRIACLTCERDLVGETMRAAHAVACGALGMELEHICDAFACAPMRVVVFPRAFIAERGKPDAILAPSDGLRGRGASGSCRHAEFRVPGDVLLIGCGGSDEAEYAVPTLTSILFPVGEVCRLAWEVLRGQIESARVGGPLIEGVHSNVLPASLAIRESSTR